MDQRGDHCPHSQRPSIKISRSITFDWLTDLLAISWKRGLDDEDVWHSTTDTVPAESLGSLFRYYLSQKIPAPLRRAILRKFSSRIILTGILQLIGNVFNILTPFMLRFLISHVDQVHRSKVLRDSKTASLWPGLALTLTISTMYFVKGCCSVHATYQGSLLGADVQRCLTENVLTKFLDERESSPDGHDEVLTGRYDHSAAQSNVIAYVTTHTERVGEVIASFHQIWTLATSLVLAMVLLSLNLGFHAVIGVLILLAGMPLIARVIMLVSKSTNAIDGVSQGWKTSIEDLTQHSFVVRCLSWQDYLLGRLHSLHKIQVRLSLKSSLLKSAFSALSLILPSLAITSTLIWFSFSTDMKASVVFSSAAMFNSLRMPLQVLPKSVNEYIEASSSMDRVESYLKDYKQDRSSLDPFLEHAIKIEEATFSWHKIDGVTRSHAAEDDPDCQASQSTRIREPQMVKTTKLNRLETLVSQGPSMNDERQYFKLSHISLSVGRRELIGITGTVAGGKTSLLAAIDSTMPMFAGSRSVSSRPVSCHQDPWLYNGTVRDNILFGSAWDESWYREVTFSTALQHDFKSIPLGDLAYVGQRGVKLSGGQKQRISLARAIYSKSNIVLLDNVLSALDPEIARHIFTHAILGILGSRCRLMCTDNLAILSQCDRILWLDGGIMTEARTFQELIEWRAKVGQQSISHESDCSSSTEHSQRPTMSADTRPMSNTKRSKRFTVLPASQKKSEESRLKRTLLLMKDTGRFYLLPVTIFFYLTALGTNVAALFWLSLWSSKTLNLAKTIYPVIYASIILLQIGATVAFSVLILLIGFYFGTGLHFRVINRLCTCRISIFHEIPPDEITDTIRRSTEDVEQNLPLALRNFLMTFGTILSCCLLASVLLPLNFLPVLPLLTIAIVTYRFSRPSTRFIRRKEIQRSSKMTGLLQEIITGADIISAYGQQTAFRDRLRVAAISWMDSKVLVSACRAWLAFRLNSAGTVLILSCCLIIVLRKGTTPDTAGVVLVSIFLASRLAQIAAQQYSSVHQGTTSMEKLFEFCDLEEEEERERQTPRQSPLDWPRSGHIKLENVSISHNRATVPVLTDVSFELKPGQKAAIIGRTGAGKSSLMGALLGFNDVSSGSIIIDNLDIRQISPRILRSKVTVVPQQAFTVDGTLRLNLDPYDEYSDEELHKALRAASFREDTRNPLNLNQRLAKNGAPLSPGQIQHISLARAFLKQNCIIILDEAMNILDKSGLEAFQSSCDSIFREKTVLNITHDLESITGYDLVLFMADGKLAEIGKPLELLKEPDSLFKKLYDEQMQRP